MIYRNTLAYKYRKIRIYEPIFFFAIGGGVLVHLYIGLKLNIALL